MILDALAVNVRRSGSRILSDVDLHVDHGEVVAVVGPSGAGKTTLLNICCGIDLPDSGCVRLDGQDLTSMSEQDRARVRLRSIGLVFQRGELLPELSLQENVALPLRLNGNQRAVAEATAREYLSIVGLDGLRARNVESLSGGEYQRGALARGLVTRPKIVIADEPTASLDLDTAAEIADVLVETAKTLNIAILVATHDMRVADLADRVVTLGRARVC